MRLLLDTHAMYWYIEDDPQLSVPARTAIQDARNEILISPASYWEIAIKVSIGEWRLNRPYEEFVDLGLNRYGFQILPIVPVPTARLIGLPFPSGHKDPFDRLLVAQALAEQISIVSADSALDAYGITRLWLASSRERHETNQVYGDISPAVEAPSVFEATLGRESWRRAAAGGEESAGGRAGRADRRRRAGRDAVTSGPKTLGTSSDPQPDPTAAQPSV